MKFLQAFLFCFLVQCSPLTKKDMLNRKKNNQLFKPEVLEKNNDLNNFHKTTSINFFKNLFNFAYPKTLMILATSSLMLCYDLLNNSNYNIDIIKLEGKDLFPWETDDRPPMGVVSICTRRKSIYMNPKIKDYGFRAIEASHNNKIEYCNQHKDKIDCLIAHLDYEKMDDGNSYKYKTMLKFFPYYKHLIWVDCDTLFTNFSKKISDYSDLNYDFIIGKDRPKSINNGVYITSTNINMRYFFKFMIILQKYLYYPSKPFLKSKDTAIKDQPIMQIALKVFPGINIQYIEINKINAYPSYMGYRRKDFVGGSWKKGDIIKHYLTCFRSLKYNCISNFIIEGYCSQHEEIEITKNNKINMCSATYTNPNNKIEIDKSINWKVIKLNLINKIPKFPNKIYFIDATKTLNPITPYIITELYQAFVPTFTKQSYELIKRTAFINKRSNFLLVEYLKDKNYKTINQFIKKIPTKLKWIIFFKKDRLPHTHIDNKNVTCTNDYCTTSDLDNKNGTKFLLKILKE